MIGTAKINLLNFFITHLDNDFISQTKKYKLVKMHSTVFYIHSNQHTISLSQSVIK